MVVDATRGAVHTGDMALAWAVVGVPAPIRALTFGVTDIGLALLAFGDRPDLAGRAATRLGEPLVSDQALTGMAAQQLTEYLAGDRRVFDVPLDWRLSSGPGLRVLRALYETVPFGETVTYGELAARSGLGTSYTAARGVGSIMGANPIAVVVPCHRVLAADGLGGFGGGRPAKEQLLALEGALTAPLF
jgi:methylated-DNA-[protein]-cysteine S-methyltransferase